MKTCKTCAVDRPFDQFERWKKPSGATGYRAVCRSCREVSRKPGRSDYAQQNADKLSQYAATWRDENRGKYRDMHQRWRDANRDKVRAADRKYHAANTLKRVLKARKREAEELRAMPAWADPARIAEVYELAKEFREAGLDVHVDHVVPLRGENVSGLHVHTNLRVCLAKMNIVKSNSWQT